MILLDSNVLSALMNDPPDGIVVTWLNRQRADEIWTSAVNVFEIRSGISCLPRGRRRSILETGFETLVTRVLTGRIAPLDRAAALEAGELSARRRSRGITVDVRDTLIAGIALTHRATVATRNVRHFQDLETGTINPWQI